MIAPTNCNPYCDCAQRMVRCQKAAPPYVIPASLAAKPITAPTDILLKGTDLASMSQDELLEALEKEFPATMGIAPLIPEDSPVTLRELTPLENAAFDRTDKVCRLIKAFRSCDLDCGMWSDSALVELAELALVTLEAG